MRSLKRVETPSRVWLVAAAVPLAIDWSLGFAGIWHNTHLSRFATGALLGATAAFYVVPGLIDLSRRRKNNGGDMQLPPLPQGFGGQSSGGSYANVPPPSPALDSGGQPGSGYGV